METSMIRNIAFISHGGAGKTSLIEAVLYNTGATQKIGNIESGTSVMDFDQIEIERKFSINAKVASVTWNKNLLNIIDTPGYTNFLHETKCALSAVDGAVIIASAITGVKAETIRVWQYAEEYNLSKLIFINKMDKERADFYKALGDIEKAFGIIPLPIFLPIGKESTFKGIIDLVRMKALMYPSEPTAQYTIEDIPAELMEEAEHHRQKLIETASETDDALIEKYLEGQEFTEEEIRKGLREGVVTKRFVPVFCGSAIKNIGSKLLLEGIIDYLPSPLQREAAFAIDDNSGEPVDVTAEDKEFSAYVFKTFADPFAGKLTVFRIYSGKMKNDSSVYNVNKKEYEKISQLYILQGKNFVKCDELTAGQIGMTTKLKYTETFDTLSSDLDPVTFPAVSLPEPVISFSITPKSKEDEDKVSSALHKLMEEDKGIKLIRDDKTGDLLLSGMGQMHVEVVAEKLLKKFNVQVELNTPKVPYMETIKIKANGQGKYKKQSGGKGQYGDVWLELSPLERGAGFEFEDRIVGGVVPRNFIPAVEKGIIEAAYEGVLAGYPMVDFKAALYDGSYHSVDSSEMAFKIAASMAFKKIAAEAKPVILEPIMILDVYCPEQYVGAIVGDLNSRRGRITNVEPQTAGQHISASVPMAEVLKYAPDLRSMTGGHGMFTMEFSHYEELPSHLANKLINEKKD